MQIVLSAYQCRECCRDELEFRRDDGAVNLQTWERTVDVPDAIAERLLAARAEEVAAIADLLTAFDCENLDDLDSLVRFGRESVDKRVAWRHRSDR